MCFSDALFPYGPFAPHYIARQYIENYFSIHATDKILELNTTVEDLSQVPKVGQKQQSNWRLTLRKYDPARLVDVWWEEFFDAVVLANGHYSVPYVRTCGIVLSIHQIVLTAPPDPSRARAFHIYYKISEPRVSLQNIPFTTAISRKESSDCWQFSFGARYLYGVGICRTAACLLVQEKQS